MDCMPLAKLAVLFKLNTVWVVLLVFHSVVVTLLAICTCQGYLYPHFSHLT